MTSSEAVTLQVERELLASGGRHLAGMDEVGRGALAGPVSVGVVIVEMNTPDAPTGVRDSKQLRAEAREKLVEPVRSWAKAYGVGHATSSEIDEVGIIAALRLAGRRALDIAQHRLGGQVDLLLLDGRHDWFTSPEDGTLFDHDEVGPRVVTRIKADTTCASVAAASILAKVERDERMCELGMDYPWFNWAGNKGYASAEHMEALRTHGPSAQHRVSWNLPTSPDGLSHGG